METSYLNLAASQVFLSLIMVGLAALLMWVNQTRLERQYLLATVRAFVQLWAMGYVLLWIFESGQGWVYILTVEIMVLVGAYTAARRQDHFTWPMLISLAIALQVNVVVMISLMFGGILQTSPLSNPHLFIPLTGMLIGNCANSAALLVHRLYDEVKSHRGQIEAALALGAAPRQAMQPYLVATMRNAVIPSLNSMMMMGIVQIPGIMSGQLLSGIPPEQAMRYQIVVVYLLAGGVALTCHLMVWLEVRRLFTSRWALK